MRRCFLFLLTVIVLVACKGKDNVPSGILPPDKMETVLWDMMRADILVTNYMTLKDPATIRDTAVTKLYHTIFNLHNITEAKFNKSFLYYKNHPELLKQVMDSISVQPKPVIQPDSVAEKTKKDSLQKKDSIQKADSVAKKDTVVTTPQSIINRKRKDSLLKRRRIIQAEPL